MLLHGKVKGRISVKLSIMWLFGWAWFLMLRTTIRIQNMMKIIMSMVDGNDDDDDFSFCDNSKSFVFRIYSYRSANTHIHTYICIYLQSGNSMIVHIEVFILWLPLWDQLHYQNKSGYPKPNHSSHSYP